MRFIDTHTHIYATEFDADRPNIIRSAKKAGIQAVLLPNEDSGSIDSLHAVCDLEPDFAYPMMGLHPNSVDRQYAKVLHAIESALTRRTYYAIGEIGIDLYWDKKYRKEQKIAFEEQLRWSRDLQLPVAIHTRDSFNEALDSLHKVGTEQLKGVFHCFGGTIEEWLAIAELSSFYVGIGGVITFKNNRLQETIKEIPIEKIVLETDAPYLAPMPYRGKRNEPAYLIETARKVAACLGMTTDAVAEATTRNSLSLFNIPTKSIDVEAI